MKKVFFIACTIFFFYAGESGTAELCNYTNGVAGIKVATLPPPGKYYLLYHIYYHANEYRNQKGVDSKLGYNLSVYAQAHRFVWMTNKKILGADVGLDVAVPFLYQRIKIESLDINDSSFGLGDICIEPFFLAWHKPRYDLVVGLGGYAPTGRFDANKPSSVGKDRWTGMLGGGGTYYFDKKRSWSISALPRFEMHAEERKTRITPGNDFHFEWGIGKTIIDKWVWEVGAAGYCQWQVTNDRGIAARGSGLRDRVFSAGPEINVFLPHHKLNVCLRSAWEFNAHDRPQGNMTVLTLTKKF